MKGIDPGRVGARWDICPGCGRRLAVHFGNWQTMERWLTWAGAAELREQGWDGLAGSIGRREERERASLERLRGVQVKGTPTEAQAASVTSDGTPTGGILEVAADKTVRPSSGEGLGEGAEGRSGRTVTVYS
ncbi:hypothetical protein L915_21933 [Phytophthora nicotianae]|uniref:Uncharacterized protein n=1 Tax=Phytophthora nicotianae TaxID=4792 RepID=W2FIX7_PHYNI|nr:hypothetical protein L915_21933 [Phytophthora nicotianae]